MITVLYTSTFLRQYRKLPMDLQEEIDRAIALFESDPNSPSLKNHKLKEKMKDWRSMSVNYKFRIVFQEDAKGVYAMLAVGDHDIYK